MNRAEAVEIVRSVVQEITGLNEIGEDTDLFQMSSPIDSMDFVRMAVTIELRMEQNGVCVQLMTDKAFSQKRSPFKSVGALADYIMQEAVIDG